MTSKRPPGPPKAPAGFLAISVLTLARRMRADLDERLATLDITLRGFATLGHLSRQPGLSYSELARRAGITVQSMHALVRTLEGNGLVSAAASTPGAAASLVLTDAGRDVLRRARRAVTRTETSTFRALPAEDRAELARMLFTSLGVPTSDLEA